MNTFKKQLFIFTLVLSSIAIQAQTAVFTETFNTTWTSCNVPNSWTSEDACGSAEAWHRNTVTTGWTSPTLGSPGTTGYDNQATYARFHSYGNGLGKTSDLITPAIDLSLIKNPTLTFYHKNTSGTDSVTVSFSNDGGTTWVTVGAIGTSASWLLKTYVIPSENFVSNFKIRFRATSDNGTSDIGLDQVVVSGSFDPVKFAITSINSGATIGKGLPFSITVRSQDHLNGYSNVIENTDFNIELVSGNGQLSGTLTGTIPAGSSTNTVSGILYNKAESGVSLQVVQTAGDILSAATSSTFTVNDSSLVLTAAPSLGYTNTILQPFIVTIKRGDGVTATGSSNVFTLTKLTGPGTLSGTLTKSAVSGVVTFDDIAVDQVGSYSFSLSTPGFTAKQTSIINIMQTAPAPNFGVSGGGFHALMLNANGTVSSWGSNLSGQLGRGTMSTIPEPLAGVVTGLSSILMVSAGSGSHSLALDCNGNVWAWGLNNKGQLGKGTSGDSTLIPAKVLKGEATSSDAYLDNVVSIVGGGSVSYALLDDGRVVSWGDNYNYQLGNKTVVSLSPTPVFVRLNDGSALSGIIAISAGDAQCYALSASGNVYSWGMNSNNELGRSGGSYSNYAAPVTVSSGGSLANIVKITAGDTHGLFLDASGCLWSVGGDWGSGQRGISSAYDSQIYAAKVASGDLKNITGNDFLTHVIDIAAGQQHSTAVVDPDGDGLGYLMVWGSNDVQQTGTGMLCNGTGATADKELPVFAKKSVVTTDTLKNVIAVSKGDAVTYIQTYNTTTFENEIWAAGANNKAMLGDGTTVDKGYPVAIQTFGNLPAEPCPVANLGQDTIKSCLGSTVKLNAGNTEGSDLHYIWYKDNVMMGSNDVTNANNQNWVFDATYDNKTFSATQAGTYKVEIYTTRIHTGCSLAACVKTDDEVVVLMPEVMIDTIVTLGCAGDSIQFAFVSNRTEGGRFNIYSTATGGTPIKTISIASADTVRFNIDYDAAVKVNDSTFTMYVEDASFLPAEILSKSSAAMTSCNSTTDNFNGQYSGIKVYKDLVLNSVSFKMKGWTNGKQYYTPIVYASTSDITSGTRPNTSAIVWTGTAQSFDYTTVVQEYNLVYNCKLPGSSDGTVYWLAYTGASGSGVLQKLGCVPTFPQNDNLDASSASFIRWAEFNCDGCTSTGYGSFYNMQFEKWKFPCNRILLSAKSKCNTCIAPAPVSISLSTGDSTLCPGTSVKLQTNSQANSNYEYVWFKNSVSDATRVKLPVNALSDNISVSQSAPGTYYVLVRSKHNQREVTCQSMDQQVIVADAAPTISGVISNSVCLGRSATLKAGGAVSYVWNTAATIDSIVVSPAVKTTYTVTATAANGCTASKTATLTVGDCVFDYDNNNYGYTKIGSLNWMTSNLKTTHYADGTGLVDGTGAGITTGDVSTKYYFMYNDSSTYNATYGLLYTWAAAMNGAASATATPSGIQGVCPTGWHLPSKAEYDSLIFNLGGDTLAGGKLKSTGTLFWYTPNTSATNTSGFGALPGGYRNSDSISYERRIYGNFWVTDELSAQRAKVLRLSYNSKVSTFSDFPKEAGVSVRCVKDYCNGVTVDAGANQSICIGKSATLAANGNGSFNWSNGATVSDITVTPTATTTYKVTVVTSYGCTASDSIVVTVNALPTPDISGANPLCLGKSDTLVASGGAAYNWVGGGSSTNKIISPIENTLYTVTVTSSQGCSASKSVLVPIKTDCPLPYALLNGDSIFVYPIDNVDSGPWAPNGLVTNAQSMTNGVENTARIIQTHGPGNYPAYLCDTLNAFGFNDWYLPARDELNAIHTYKANIPNMDYWYWTSTESYLTSDALIQNFTSVNSGNIAKSSNMSARCIRRELGITLTSNGGWLCDGKERNFTTAVTGGSLPYTYKWSTGETVDYLDVSPSVSTTYTVTVTDGNNNTATATQAIMVFPLPVIAFTGDQTICTGESTTLTASGGNSYAWNTGGNTSTLSVTPSANTTYTVTVTDANTCSNINFVSVIVNTNPTAIVDDINVCAGSNTGLSVSGGSTYLWSNSETTSFISLLNVSTSATYTVTATDANGCTDTEDAILTVYALPIASANNATICSGNDATLSASGGTSYIWSTGSTQPSITLSGVTANATYTVTVANANGCIDIENAVITVNALPTASAGGDVTACVGANVTLNASGGATYLWDNATTSASRSIVVIMSNIYTVTVTDANGCTDDATAQVTMGASLQPNAGADALICIGDSAQLMVSGGINYSWSNGFTTATQYVKPTITTTYTVTADDGAGCSGTDEVIISVKALPTVYAATDGAICAGDSALFTSSAMGGTAPFTFAWSNGATTANMKAAPLVNTTYTVTATSADGCANTADQSIAVKALPVASISADNEVCAGQSAKLTASGATSYEWSDGSTSIYLSKTPAVTTTYTLTATTNGCTDTDMAVVTVNALPTGTAGNDVDICYGTSTIIAPSSTHAFCLMPSCVAGPTYTVSPITTTDYIVQFTDNGCDQNDTVRVRVLPQVIASAGNNVTICSGSTIQLTATGADGYEWNTGQSTDIISVSPNVNTTYSVTVTDENSCSASAEVVVNVGASLVPNAGADQSICIGESTAISVTGGSIFSWSNSETSALINVSPIITTTYTVTADDGSGCTGTDEVVVTVNALPTASVTNTQVCYGAAANVTAVGAGVSGSYAWSNGHNTNELTIDPAVQGYYTVTITDVNGCSDTEESSIGVYSQLTIAAGSNLFVCKNESAQLNPTQNASWTYAWSASTGAYVGPTNSATPTISYLNPGALTADATVTYTLSVTDVNGCTATDDVVVTYEVQCKPVVDIVATTELCKGESTTLNISILSQKKLAGLTLDDGTGALSFVSTGTVPTYTANITLSPNITTEYIVTAIDINGSEGTASIVIVVNPLPTANAGVDQTIALAQTASLTATGGSEYVWNNNATFATISVSPIVKTTYTVTVTENGCTDSDEVVVDISTSTVIANAGQDVTICAGASASLTASGGNAYQWSGSAGTTAVVSVSPAVTTTYTVTVSDGTATDTDEVVVFVNALPTVSVSDMNVCPGASVTLTATASAGVSYKWNTNATSNTLLVNAAFAGTYSVVVTDANACSNQTAAVVTIIPAVVADAGEDVAICATGKTILFAKGGDSYAWSNGETTASIIIEPTATTTYTVTATANGCSGTDAVVVSVKPLPTANSGGAASICAGQSVMLNASGGSSYQWKNGPATNTYSVTPEQTTKYSVIVSENGCTDSDTLTITVKPIPTVSAGADVAVCKDGSTSLTAQGNGTYLWSNSATTAAIQLTMVNTPTTYTVVVTNNACTASDDVVVSIQTPAADAGLDKIINEGNSVALSATGGDSYAWSTGKSTQEIIVEPTAATTYTVTVTDSKGCTATDDVKVSVLPCAKPTVPTQQSIFNVCEDASTSVELIYTGDNVKFQWVNENQQIVSLSNIVTIDSANQDDAGVYTCSLSNTCGTASATFTLAVKERPSATVTTLGATSFCQGDSVILVASAGTYFYKWMKDAKLVNSGSNPYYTVKSSGTYDVVIKDTIQQCSNQSDEIVVTVNPNNFDVSYTVDKQLLIVTPFVVQFTNTTPNASDYTFKWTFGDSKTSTSSSASVINQYTYNGTYDVSLTAVNKLTGCVNQQYDSAYIMCMAENNEDPCDTKIKITRTGSNKICVGDSVLLATVAPQGSVYTWTLDDEIIAGAENDSLYVSSGGEYSVTAEWGDGCEASARSVKIATYPAVTPEIVSEDVFNACLKNEVELSVNVYFKEYVWSTAAATATETVNAEGIYTVTVTDLFGCKFASAPYTVAATPKAAPQICIVSVDKDSKKNVIAWEKENDPSIKSYNIYGETSSSNVYQKLGSVNVALYSVYTDAGSTPATRSQRYKITSVDTCGTESAMSEHHKTLHLGVGKNSQGFGYNLNWVDAYEGFDYSMYYVMRSENGGDFEIIDSIPSNLLSYSDPTKKTGRMFYTIAAVKPGYECNPTGTTVKGVLPIEFKGASYSNVSDETGAFDAIEEVNNIHISIHPNPVSDVLVIETNNAKVLEFELVDLLGKVIYKDKVLYKANIDMKGIANGVYFVKINSSVKKFVVNH